MLLSILSIFLGVFLFYGLYKANKKRYQSGWRILAGLIVGIGYGFLLKSLPSSEITTSIQDILRLIGDGYLALLKMLVIPLILTSIIHAILHLGSGNNDYVKRMSITTVAMLLGMTAVSSAITLGVGTFFHVGEHLSLPTYAHMQLKYHEYNGIIDTLLGMVPSNPIAIMAKENTAAVVIFAVLLGLSARMLDKSDHEKMETFRQLMASMFAIVKKLAVLVLGLTPYAVMSLMALLVADQGITLLTGMLNFLTAIYIAMFLVFVMHTIILMCIGIHPLTYFKNALTPLIVAFTTRSSFGTLPVAEETLRDKFKTNQVIATFVPSLGATIGMNACAGVFPAMLVVMALGMMHQPLTMHYALMVMFINAIASLGISGIPGTASIAATVTLTSLNLPYAIIALVQGIDPIVDMGRTATNVNGVLTTALVTDRVMEREIGTKMSY